MARQSYNRELLSWAILPVMLGGIESGTLAIFVKKAFTDVPGITPQLLNYAIATITAAKAIGHLTSFIWASLSHGRPKIRFIFWLQLITAATVMLISLVPRTPWGLLLVTGLSITAWMIWSGVATLRTGVWRANYEPSYRARVAGRLATMHALGVALTGLVVGFCLDYDSSAYHILFPLLGSAGIAGALVYRKVRMRQQGRLVQAERDRPPEEHPSLNPIAFARILREDSSFRGYMVCMFLLGTGNLMLHAPLAIVLNDEFGTSYSQGILVTAILPLLLMTLAIPLWRRLLDRMHVVRFRAIHAWAFVSTTSLFWLGTATHQLPLLYLAAAMLGVGYGGGVLAWNLGHQHFAPRHRDAEYMGVHVTLTGIRGFLGPLFAVAMYGWLSQVGRGDLVFAVCVGFNVSGALGFAWLARRLRY